MAMELFRLMGTVAIAKEGALQDIKAIQTQAQKSTSEMGASFSKFTAEHSAQFKKVGMVAAAAGAVIMLAIRNINKSFEDYQTRLVDMGRVTDESLETIAARIKSIPPILGSATELLTGYYQILSAGVTDTNTAMDLLVVGSQTAKSAHIGQEAVILGLTKVLAGYEGGVKDATEAADLMFAIDRAGQTTVAELIPVIGGLAKISHDLGISQDELGGSMAVITQTAGSTSDAATQYEAVLRGLLKPTTELKNLIKSWGFESSEAAIKSLGFVEVLNRLKESAHGNSEIMATLFGRAEAMMGMSALSAKNFDVLRTAIVSVTDKIGESSEAYQRWSTTSEALNESIKNGTVNLKILIGEALDPMMTKLKTHIAEIIVGLGKWVEKNPELATTIAEVTGGLGAFMIPFGALMMMLPGLVIAVPKIIGFIGILSDGFAGLALSLGLSTGGLSLLLAGLAAVGLYIGREWSKALAESKRIREAEVGAAEAQVTANEKLRKAYDLTDEEMQYWIENHKLSASVLERVKEKADALAESENKLAEQSRELVEASKGTVKSFEELDGAVLNSIITGKELTEQQTTYIEMRQKMSALDRTATQQKIDDLDLECAALLANMETNLMTMEQIDEYRQVMLQNIIAESSERQDYLRNMEEIQNRVFEMTHTQMENEIRDLDTRTTAYVEAAKQAKLSAEEQAAAIVTIQENYNREKASILELAIARSEKELKGINDSIELRKKAGEAIDDLIKKRNEEVANLKKLKEGYDETAESLKKLTVAPSKPLYKKVGPEGETLGLQSQNILSQAEVAAGVTLVPMATSKESTIQSGGETIKLVRGGLIPTFFRAIKQLAEGGSTDTVPIWATPGEYIIKKEMVDFIKKTGMITGGLVEAIKKGWPTPSPQFAGGGVVGTWGSSRSVAGVVNAEVSKKGSWVYSPNISVLVQGNGDAVSLKEAVKEALEESANAFDFSGFEVGA